MQYLFALSHGPDGNTTGVVRDHVVAIHSLASCARWKVCSVEPAPVGRVVLRRNFASLAGGGYLVFEPPFASVASATQHTTEAN